jgi:N12 class adenine-specific DNA methylase
MYVVPNYLLEQFAREFMQLYPNARLLVASKEDLSRDRRTTNIWRSY